MHTASGYALGGAAMQLDAQKLEVCPNGASKPGAFAGRPAKCRKHGASRSFLQQVAETLRRLNPALRRQSIARLSAEQRLALEKHMIAAPTRSPGRTPKRCKTTKSRRSSFSSRKSKQVQVLEAKVAGRPAKLARSLSPKGLSQKSMRGWSYYFATVGCESLIFHCRPVRSRAIALTDLETLQRLKSLLAVAEGTFEERLASAVASLRADDGLRCSEIKVFVRSATQHWLGRDLHTPSWKLGELEAVLDARRRLQAARGTVMVGGCGLLSQCSIPEANELWTRIRRAYLEVCAAVPGCHVSKRAENLDRAEAAFAAHRSRMQDLAKTRQLRRSERLERKEKAMQRCQQREVLRAQKAAHQAQLNDERALRKMDKLLERWSKVTAASGAA